MNAIRLYFRLVRVSLRTQMAYRASFSVQMPANIATTLADFFAVFAFFQRFGALGHWSFAQVAVFYGMANASLALSELWLRGFDIFERHVQSGDFDRYLIRPRSAFLQVLGADFQLLRLGRTGVGLVTSFWGLSQLAPGWQASEWALFFLAILGGNFFYGGVVLVRAMVSVWTVQSLELFNMITYGGVETAQYPLDIYTGFFAPFLLRHRAARRHELLAELSVPPAGSVRFQPGLAFAAHLPGRVPAMDRLAHWRKALPLDWQLRERPTAPDILQREAQARDLLAAARPT